MDRGGEYRRGRRGWHCSTLTCQSTSLSLSYCIAGARGKAHPAGQFAGTQPTNLALSALIQPVTWTSLGQGGRQGGGEGRKRESKLGREGSRQQAGGR